MDHVEVCFEDDTEHMNLKSVERNEINRTACVTVTVPEKDQSWSRIRRLNTTKTSNAEFQFELSEVEKYILGAECLSGIATLKDGERVRVVVA